MALSFEYDLETVKLNQRAKYLGHMSYSSEFIVRTHALQQLLNLDH